MASPVLLLHGVPTGAYWWRELLAALAEDPDPRHVLAPDLPGCGGVAPLADQRVEAHLAWLEGWRRAGDLPPWAQLHLVGTDHGGLLAAWLAARHGARILSLCSTALGLGWLPARITAWPPLDAWFYRRHGGRLWLSQAVAPERRNEVLERFSGVLSDPDLPERMRQMALGLGIRGGMGLPARLRASGLPIQLVWGRRDRHYPLPSARILARWLVAPLHTVPGVGHGLPIEAPQALAALLRPFWEAAEGR